MAYTYAVLGAGRQGTAAAYDIARWGEAELVILADVRLETAQAAARRVNQLLDRTVVEARHLDVSNLPAVEALLQGVDSVLSAVPYYMNIELTQAAIGAGASFCDLGGHTGIARQQHEFDAAARQAGVSVIPNCGQVPGLGTTMVVYTMGLLDQTVDVLMWDGGIPQKPRPPFNYLLTFNIEGLTNEYAEPAVFLRDWKVTEVEPMTELETIDLGDGIGVLEAFVAGGGTDTMPWTYEGKVRTLQNKTLRWPGNFTQIRAFYDLGLWDLKPVEVKGVPVVPRDVFHTLFLPKVTYPEDKDLVIVRVLAKGTKDGRPAQALVQVTDRHDQVTGFTAMERCTGWSAAIVAELMARRQTPPGAGGVESMVPAVPFMEELRKRGVPVRENVEYTE